MAKKNLTANRIFLYLLLFIFIVLAFLIVKPYFGILVLAYLYCLVLQPVYEWLNKKLPSALSTIVTLLASILVIVVPFVILVGVASSDVVEVIDGFRGNIEFSTVNELLDSVNQYIQSVAGQVGMKIDVDFKEIIINVLNAIKGSIFDGILSLSSSVVEFVIGFIIFVFVVFSLFPNLSGIYKSLKKYLPLDDRQIKLYVNRSNTMLKDTVKASVVTAIVQGLVGGFMLVILGVPYAFFFTILIMIFSALPVFGSGLVTVPIAIVYIVTGDYFTGIALLLWQIFVIGTVDNFLRPHLMSKDTSISQVVLLLAMLGGIKVFGVMGLIYGPIIIILLSTTVEMFVESEK